MPFETSDPVKELRDKARDMFPHSEELARATYHWNAADEIERLRFNGREAIVAWMFKHGYATGPGDTIEDLLVELEGQAKDRGANRSY